MKKIKRQQVLKKIDEIIPYINNPRNNEASVDAVASSIKNFGFNQPIAIDTNNEASVDAVASSIKNFGFNQPIAIDTNNEIIAGHTRFKAAKKLGLTEVPCIIIDDLTDEEVRAYRLADNKVAESSTWDKEMLQEELAQLGDFDMALFGFDEVDFKDNFEDDEFDVEEELEIIEEPQSKVGDVFKLGDHLLLCGDSTKAEDVEKIIKKEEADLVITDPPYNVDYKGKMKKREKIQNDNMDEDEFLSFLQSAFKNMKTFLKPGGVFYIWHASLVHSTFKSALQLNELEERQILIWIKQHFVLGRQDYQWKHEPCIYGWKDGAAHYFTSDLTNTTVYDDVPNLARMNKDELKEYAKELLNVIENGTTVLREDRPMTSLLHPTMKPVPLIAKQIKNSSKVGEIVLDLFGGSGTTLIACEQTKRRARIVELDPRYVDVIIARWEKHTGKKAEKIRGE